MSRILQARLLSRTLFTMMVMCEQIFRRVVSYVEKRQSYLVDKAMDFVFYRGGPGEVTFGKIDEDDRVDGYIYFRDYDRHIRKIPFNVQNLPRADVWPMTFTRKVTTQALGLRFNVVWIERNGLVTSPSHSQWEPANTLFMRSVVMCS